MSVFVGVPKTENPLIRRVFMIKRLVPYYSLVELRRFELPASTMRMSRAPNCATAPYSW